jgi:hypothetical protein
MERPWLRDPKEFKHPRLRSWALEHRGELIWAALTLIRAWIVRGRPEADVRPLGSYEEWSRVMAGILATAGVGGFLANVDAFYEASDIEGAVWGMFVASWWERFASNPVSAGALFPLAEATDGFDLGDAKTERAQKITFGKRLAQKRDSVIGEHRIVQAGSAHKQALWQLLPTSGGMWGM